MVRARLAKLLLVGCLGICCGCACSERPLFPRIRAWWGGGNGCGCEEPCCDVTGYDGCEGGPVLSDLGGFPAAPVPGPIPGAIPPGGYPQLVPPGTPMPSLVAPPPGARIQTPPGGMAPTEPYRPMSRD